MLSLKFHSPVEKKNKKPEHNKLVSSHKKWLQDLHLIRDGEKLENDMMQRIWVYNLWTEPWSRNRIPRHPSAQDQCGVVIELHAYFLGGQGAPGSIFYNPNDIHLWKLTLSNGSFEWSAIEIENYTKKLSQELIPVEKKRKKNSKDQNFTTLRRINTTHM